MVVRKTAAGDRRSAQLWLTEAATQRLTAWRQARAELIGSGVAGLPAAERQALARGLPALRALLAALDATEER